VNRIDATFEALAAQNQAAFIPFLTAGDPDLGTTRRTIAAVADAGADVIELGFPFSDPIADGPTIQASYTRALDGGQRTEDVFRMVEALRAESQIPVVAMISYSLVYRMGFDAFLDRAIAAGIDGATIPDLPVEEMEPLRGEADRRDFRLVCFVTPATTDARRTMAARLARGFIYYISVRGITGARDRMPADLAENIGKLKSQTQVPVAVGFGISRPEHARAVGQVADGVIVGSALVSRMHGAAKSGGDPVRVAADFVAQMATATHSARTGAAGQ
jgi:tryptophan synthase alpha chain